MQRCRHPDLDAYIGDAVSALRRPIAAGDVKRVVLAIKDDDAAASDGPLERFTFDFLPATTTTQLAARTAGGLNGEASLMSPGAPFEDRLAPTWISATAFAACLSKIASPTPC